MESYPFDDVTPQFDGGDPAASPSPSPTGSRVRKIATGAAIGVAVLATGGVAIAATHTGSTTAQGGPGGGGPGGGGFGGPGGTAPTGTAPGGTTGTAPTGTPPTGTAPTGTPPSGAPTTGSTAGGTATTPQAGSARRGPGGIGGAGDLQSALHGTFVLPATSGTGTTTEDLQTGKVTAVSATSISVSSTDKTAGVFVVTSATKVNGGQSTIGDVKVGDTVTVIATDAGKSALTVEDRTLAPAAGGHRGFGGGMPDGAPAARGGENT